MHIAHHPIFIALSSLTAWLGAWTALDVFRRVRAHVGGWRLAWLAATAVAMGLSIWSMHFIAMLGFNPGAEVRYDVGRTRPLACCSQSRPPHSRSSSPAAAARVANHGRRGDGCRHLHDALRRHVGGHHRRHAGQ